VVGSVIRGGYANKRRQRRGKEGRLTYWKAEGGKRGGKRGIGV
jgi:hypothetical protein